MAEVRVWCRHIAIIGAGAMRKAVIIFMIQFALLLCNIIHILVAVGCGIRTTIAKISVI